MFVWQKVSRCYYKNLIYATSNFKHEAKHLTFLQRNYSLKTIPRVSYLWERNTRKRELGFLLRKGCKFKNKYGIKWGKTSYQHSFEVKPKWKSLYNQLLTLEEDQNFMSRFFRKKSSGYWFTFFLVTFELSVAPKSLLHKCTDKAKVANDIYNLQIYGTL